MSEATTARVHLVARDNGAGLSRDITILTEAIAAGGFDLTVSALGQGGLRRGARSARLRRGSRGKRSAAAARRAST